MYHCKYCSKIVSRNNRRYPNNCLNCGKPIHILRKKLQRDNILGYYKNKMWL